jgi:hypothetical protein
MSQTRVRVVDAAPPGATGLVSRRELFGVLDRALSGRVTVVSAPPGSGKTVLLRSWLEQAEPGLRVAWVSLDLHAPNIPADDARELMLRADQRCPYSNATRGNITVALSVNGQPIDRLG